MNNVTNELRASLENAPYPRLLGFSLLELSEGYAKVSVRVRPEHANFLGFADGALIMSLASYASACSSNSLGETRVGIQSNINIIATIAIGDELIAEATVTYAGETRDVTETIVTDPNGRIIAKATGTSITSKRNNLG